MTNSPPNGAFRGFGAPQTQFAAEVQMERVAENLGMDAVRLRAINALRAGDTTATGQVLGRDTSALKVLREAVARSDFKRRRRQLKGTGRGLGLALFFHGAGFTGAGEVKLASRASLELTAKGVRILVASTEIGQGARTVHAQIVADALGPADTTLSKWRGRTRLASRTAVQPWRRARRWSSAACCERCATEMRRRLGRMTPAEYLRRHGPLVVTKDYEPPTAAVFDEETYRGDAYGTYAWACDVVEVELDPVTSRSGRSTSPPSKKSGRRSTRRSPPARSKAARCKGSATRCSKRW